MKAPLPVPCLCLVTDRGLCRSDLGELEWKVAAAIRGGVDLVQLREKDLTGRELLMLAERLKRVTGHSATLIINDRIDVALACGAEGVQLGEEAIPVDAARKVAGNELLLGRSVHTLEGALVAEEHGADFILAGTIYATGSHPDSEPAGPQFISQLSEKVKIPIMGIGGISTSNVGRVMDSGGSGTAVISAILSAEDPEQAARALKGTIDGAWNLRRSRQESTPLVVASIADREKP
jgi:thiamine-phosphate diphosphorylase